MKDTPAEKRPTGRPRNPTPVLPDTSTKDRYVEALRGEVESATASVARMTGLRLLAQVQGYLDHDIPDTVEAEPTDPVELAEADLSIIRRMMRVTKRPKELLALLREAKSVRRDIQSLKDEHAPSFGDDLAALESEVHDWPDLAVSIIVAEARRRGML